MFALEDNFEPEQLSLADVAFPGMTSHATK